MPYIPPTTQEIISRYDTTYSSVENSAFTGAFMQGLEQIKSELKAYNVTGEKAAAYMMQYVSTATTNIVANSQQTALSLITTAYRMPQDAELTNAQKDLANAQIELVNEQKIAAEEMRPYDIRHKEVQTTSLQDSITQNSLIRLNAEAGNFIATMTANAMVPPQSVLNIYRMAAKKAFEILKIGNIDDVPKPLTVWDYTVTDSSGDKRRIRMYKLPLNGDKFRYEIIRANGEIIQGTGRGGDTVLEELAGTPIATSHICWLTHKDLFTADEIAALDNMPNI
ncbi:MAG: hypothetical protein LBV09_08370 [Deferribacteraceae bacterium]|jgi:hypothetical protein|nr:hypothetical protein [Deferribacteraceae bacterium]